MDFDSWTGDTIACCEDHNTLVKAAKYFREQGFYPTAEAIDSRLKELGVVKAASPPAVELDTAEAKRSILSFQEESKKLLQQQRDRLTEARQQGMQAELHPPVRGAINGKKANLGSAKDTNSQAAAVPRESLDLSDQKDQQLLGPGGLKLPSSGTAPKAATGRPAAAAAAAAAALGLQEEEQQAKPLIEEVVLTGAKRTQQLVQQNMQLPAADRRAMAASKRASGNDHFRAGAYADAVEEYTLSVSLDPAAVPVYTNRAAAYLKLKEWQAAAADCDMALTLLEGETGDKDKLDDLRSKACLRRAEALAAMGNNQAALEDWKAVLQLYPEEPKAKQGVEAAEKSLGISSSSSTATQPGMRRIAVQEAECSDDDDDEDDEDDEEQAAATAPAAEAEPQQQQQEQLLQQPEQQQQAETLIGTINESSGAGSSSSSSSTNAAAEAAAHDLGETAASRAAAAAVEQSAAEPVSGHAADADAAAAAVQPGFDAADMAARIKAAAEAHAAAEAYDNSSSSDSDFDSASEDNADDDDLAAAAGGFSKDADVADPLAESAVELPPSYEQRLDQLREAGNAKFRTGAYAEAINLYEQALSHAPSDVRLYNNCAIAKLYLEKFDAAHKDATLAIALDPTNSKAFHRRHKAKIGLKDYMGAMLDLQQCMKHVAAKERKALQEELEALQEQMDADIAEAETAAEAARAASAATYSSCTIEEVAEEPMEAFQRKHDELQGKEQWIARVAKGMQDTAAQLRKEWEQGRRQQQECEQHRLQQLQQQRQRQQQERERMAAVQAEAAARRAAREARRKLKADKAAAAAAADAAEAAASSGSRSSAALDILSRRSGRTAAAAAAAEPLTPPASPYNGKLLHNAATAKAAREAAAASKAAARADAASAAAAAARSSAADTTPVASPADAPTPAGTPAGSYKAASTLLQQQQRRQQQQQHSRAPPTAAEVQQSLEQRVEAFKQQGNAALKAGQLAEAEAAYMEALQLDGDNVKVLLNLAQLRLAQKDGAGAVRAAEEVLALPGVEEDSRRKATLRLGLGLELKGDVETAMWHVSQLYNEYIQNSQPVPEQLKRDMERIATALQQLRHPGLAAAEEQDADSTAAGSSSQPHADQQQPAAAEPAAAPPAAAAATATSVPAFTGMRSSIPVKFESDSEEESEEGAAQPQQQQASISTPGNSDAAAAAAGSSTQPAGAASRSGLTKIAVVCESSSEDEEDEAVQEPSVSAASETPAEAAADSVTAPPSEAASSVTVAAAEPAAAAVDAPALQADSFVSSMNVAAAKQQPHGAVLHQRSRSAGEGDVTRASDDAAGQALARLMKANNMSRAQQQVVHSSSASSTDSDSISSEEDSLVNEVERAAHAASMQQRVEKVAQLMQEQQRQQGRKQSWESVRQQWWQRLQQEHPQAFAEVDNIRQAETAVLTELLSGFAKSSSSSSSSGLDTKIGEVLYQRDDKAAAAREAGERALKQGNAQSALKHFNAAVAKQPTDPRGYAGRAQVWLRLKRPQHAEQDCGLALLLATCPRAVAQGLGLGQKGGQEAAAVDCALLGRVRRARAMAWREMGKLKEAVADLKQLLADSPSDASLQRLVADLTQAYAKQVQQAVQAAQQQGKPQQAGFEFDEVAEEQQAQTATPTAAAAAPAEPLAAEPVSHVQRHRIVIEETDGSGSETDEDDARFVPTAAAAVPQQQAPQQGSSSTNQRQDAAAGSARAAAAGQQSTGSKTAPPAAAQAGAATAGSAAAVPAAAAAAAAASERLTQQLMAKQPSPPKTATEFIAAAKLLSAKGSSSSSQALGQYVRQLDPAKYKAVFKRELSEGLIRWLVQGLQSLVGQEPQFVAAALLQLSQVERFSMVLPMAAANKGTKAALQALLDALAAAGQDMAPLRAVYKLR